MKKYIPLLLLLLFVAEGCVYPSGEQPISLSNFKEQLNESGNISIVADTRSSPASGFVINCGLALVTRTSSMGKTSRFFAYEGEKCFYSSSGSSDVINSSIKECESLISNSIVFYIRYNPAKNSTLFYTSKAVIEGDENFLADCQISKII